MTADEINAYRNRILYERRKLRASYLSTDPDRLRDLQSSVDIMGIRAHLAMHYYCRAEGQPAHSLCHCGKGRAR